MARFNFDFTLASHAKTVACMLAIGAVVYAGNAVAQSAPSDTDIPTTSTYTAKPWGELALTTLRNAPFPDDSRTTGYKSSNGTFPYAGHYDDSTVAMGIPQGYRKTPTVDFILYYHGWTNVAAEAVDRYRLGEQVNASGKNAIVMVPQGPKDSKDSSIGKIAKPGGFARMMKEAVEVLIRDGKLDAGTTIGTVIVGGHSGGYMPVANTLAVGGMGDYIKEVWLWDAAYGNWSDYAAFFAKPGQRRLRSFFTDHLENENVRIISLLSLAGVRPVLVDEDDLTSASSGPKGFDPQFHVEGARPGVEEFDLLASREPILFMHTHLTHNGVVMDRNYLERLAHESPFLKDK